MPWSELKCLDDLNLGRNSKQGPPTCWNRLRNYCPDLLYRYAALNGVHPRVEDCVYSAGSAIATFFKKMQLTNPNAVTFSHVEHFCETKWNIYIYKYDWIYLNSLVHFSPVTKPVHRRLRMQSAECEESGVLSGECSVECEMGIVKCGV